jgi:hypothetical protein
MFFLIGYLFKMNADFSCPRLSPAEWLSERPEMSPQLGDELQEPPGTHVSRSLLHRPGHPVAGVGVFDWVTLPSWQRLPGLF